MAIGFNAQAITIREGQEKLKKEAYTITKTEARI
jgi:hypothetical protein